MNGEEFFLNDPNTVLKELPADMIDQLKNVPKEIRHGTYYRSR